jgi:hypothetical protein
MHTGQHDVAAMKAAFFDQLDIPEPALHLAATHRLGGATAMIGCRCGGRHK